MKLISPHTLFALASFIGIASAAQAATVLYSDDFESYADSAELRTAYPQKYGSQVSLGTTSTLAPAKYMSISNTTLVVPLGATINTDWTLTFDVIHTSYSRFTSIGLTNENGGSGYTFFWSSASSSSYEGQGYVNLSRYDNDPTAWDGVDRVGLTGNTGSGQIAVTTSETPQSMASVSLSWERATGTLDLYINGELKRTATDTTYNSFTGLYIQGNSSQLYDNILLTIPEPSTNAVIIGIFALLACLGIRFRRKGYCCQ